MLIHTEYALTKAHIDKGRDYGLEVPAHAHMHTNTPKDRARTHATRTQIHYTYIINVFTSNLNKLTRMRTYQSESRHLLLFTCD